MSVNPLDYPFSAKFLSTAQVIKPSELDCEMAKASLGSLSSLLPEGISPEESPDLVYFAANGAVAGLCNENDDCLDPSTALEVYHLSKNKYINVDHKRDIVVGAIISAGLSKYGDNSIIDDEGAKQEKVFNLSVAAVMWKAINKTLGELLEKAGDESSSEFGKVSLSWEVFFKGYDIAVGSPILSEARIVSDQAERDKLEPYLKRNGGVGQFQGEKVYRVIRNTDESKNVIIGGYSLVTNPAAQVNGIINILTNPNKEVEDENDDESDMEDGAAKISLQEKREQSEENISQSQKSFVITNIAKDIMVSTLSIKKFMDIQNLDDIKANWGEFSKLEESIAFVKVSEVFKNGIKAASDKFEAEAKAKDEAIANAISETQKALAEIAELKAAQEKATKELDEIRASQKAQVDQEQYSARLTQLEDEFDLEDSDRQAIASEILGMDEEAYAAFKKKFDSLAKYKSKNFKEEMKAKMKEELKKEMSQCSASITGKQKSVEEVAQEALASVQVVAGFVPAVEVITQDSVVDKYKSAFGVGSSKIQVKK